MRFLIPRHNQDISHCRRSERPHFEPFPTPQSVPITDLFSAPVVWNLARTAWKWNPTVSALSTLALPSSTVHLHFVSVAASVPFYSQGMSHYMDAPQLIILLTA